ncbi:ATP-binding protein [Rhodococcus kroppenstedtii]|uniref:ATP-binding protein n=1 Tax=Rhodococcoides kroppenstedtii TaxID=293050 RepID=UPI001C9AA1B1|nr:ATP-binding protein [Rhodococcus kroppenstedtii]MBY6438174.1 ATP-binding protein [Rhodococcus kroppenstedtii]
MSETRTRRHRRGRDRTAAHRTGAAAKFQVLSAEKRAALETRLAEANPVTALWLRTLLSRDDNHRRNRERATALLGDGSSSSVYDNVDGRGFKGPGGGRMATVLPPVEYRGSTRQVAGLYPWIFGASAPMIGPILGPHLKTGAPVGFSPLAAKERGAITAPSCTIIALNGFGKSTLLRRMALGDIASGIRVIWPGDVKPDGRKLTEAVCESGVNEVGYGTGSLNPIDPGPIGVALARYGAAMDDDVRRRYEFALHFRQVNLMTALCEIVRRSPLRDFEEAVVDSGIRQLYTPVAAGGRGHDVDHPARISDLLHLVEAGSEELLADVVADNEDEYRAQVKPLLRTLRALTKGRFGETFDGATTVRIDVDNPSTCLDMSAVPEGDALMRASVLIAGWSESFAAVDAAHLRAITGNGPHLAFSIVMDELWQVLSCGPTMVDRLDSTERLQRTKGVGIVKVTHSIVELDKAGAIGSFERSRARIIGPVPRSEIARLSQVMQFTEQEKTMLTNWSDSADLGTAATSLTATRVRCAHCNRSLYFLAGGDNEVWVHQDSDAAACEALSPFDEVPAGGAVALPAKAHTQRPSGMGHFLLKLGEGGRPGVPFRVWVTPAEKASGIHNTDEKLDAAADEQRRAAATR